MPLQHFRVVNNPSHFSIRSGDSITLTLRAQYLFVAVPFNITLDYDINGNGITFDTGHGSLQHTANATQVSQQDFAENITLEQTGINNACSIDITATLPDGSNMSDSINVVFV